MAIPAAAIALLASGFGLIKPKKPYVIWYHVYPDRKNSWITKSGPMSARSCRKTVEKLVRVVGLNPAQLEIFRKGVDPNV